MNDLTYDRVSALLRELGERLAGRGIEAELYIVGGVAMMLAYDRERVTRDIDAIAIPQEEVDREVTSMAADDRGLEADWLNARVLPLLPRGIDADRIEVLGGPGLTVNVASPRWMLAMKARAARDDRDLDDLWVLCQVLGLSSVSQVWEICDEVWGPGMLRDDVLLMVTDHLQSRGLRVPPRA